MSQRNKYVKKMAKKLGLTPKIVANVILYNHELNKLMPQSKLKKVNVNFTPEISAFISKVAKTLKVDEDAVVGSALIDYLEAKNEVI